MDKVEQILLEMKENDKISYAISSYGEWNHTDMWPVIEEEMTPILLRQIKENIPTKSLLKQAFRDFLRSQIGVNEPETRSLSYLADNWSSEWDNFLNDLVENAN